MYPVKGVRAEKIAAADKPINGQENGLHFHYGHLLALDEWMESTKARYLTSMVNQGSI